MMYMTVKDILDYVDEVKHNTFSRKTKLIWLNELEYRVQTDVMLLSAEGVQTIPDDDTHQLLVPVPWSEIYYDYLFMKLSEHLEESSEQNNRAATFNKAFTRFMRWWADTYNPSNGKALFKGYYLKGDKGDPFVYEDFTEEQLEALKGPAGADGTTYTPHVSEAGVLSWTNDSGKANPDPVNITGSQGETGADGIGIQSVEQTTTSTEDGGTNVITVTKTDGTSFTFTVKNGTKGSAGAAGAAGRDGYTPVRGTDYWTEADIATIQSYVNEKAAALQSKSITDSGGHFTTDTVEGALQEIGAGLALKADKSEIPTALPNPHKLTINGTEYDGSVDVQMTIQGGGGTSDHSQLTNRDAANQHPITAITGLQTALDGKVDAADIPSLEGYATEAYVQNYHDNTKQDSITDLATIRSGASKGATAVQPEAGKGLFSGNYNDLTDKPAIPDAVTEGTVSGWGFTKNTGTYSKPTGGIPKADLANDVQASLGKADTALQSHQSLAAYRTAAAQDEIDSGKVDKVTGKGLSTNDYTAAAKAKVDAIPANPKYTDTVYDDTALKERVAAIEDKDFVTETTQVLPAYTNQIPLSTDASGAVLNGVGYESGRLDMSGAVVDDPAFVSGFIPVKKGDIIRIKDPSSADFSTGLVFALYNSNKATGDNIGRYINTMQSNAAYGSISISGNVLTWDTSSISYYFWSDFAYLRVTTNSANSIVTINQEIVETTQTIMTLKPAVKVAEENLNFDIEKPLLSGRKVVVFGDSIIGMSRDQTSVPACAAAYTGAEVYNVGFGGCRMAVHPSVGYAAFSMWALADAVASGDYSSQDEQAPNGSDYFPEQMALLKSINFSDVDMIVIHYGTNDFAANVTIDNASDHDDYNTLCGALRYSIEKLLGAYPKLLIYVSLPVYRFWTSGSTVTYAETYTNSNGNTLPEFVEALRNVAAEYNLPVIDGYYGLGISKTNAATFLSDGTHHNVTGRERFGRYIGQNLISSKAGTSGINTDAVNALISAAIGNAIGGSY